MQAEADGGGERTTQDRHRTRRAAEQNMLGQGAMNGCLKPGDLVTLDPACAAQVHLRLNQIPKFTGRPGTSNGKWAVQIDGLVSPKSFI